MFNFNEYALIQEDLLVDHISHPEEQVFTYGMQGAVNAYGQLKSLLDDNTSITEKYDGAPSLLFGKHPDTGKFFVSTKSFFNRDPKINYNHNDIDRNHPNTPNLGYILKHAYDLLGNHDYDHMYRGDVMYHHGNFYNDDDKIKFKPNVLEYTVPTESKLGSKIKNSQLGIAIHTGYSGNKDNLRSFPINKIEQKPSNVTFISTQHPGIRNKSTANSILNNLKQTLNAPTSKFDIFNRDMHAALLNKYFNNTIREDYLPSVTGYQKFLKDRAAKESAKFKTAFKKDSIHTHYDLLHSQATQHYQHFDRALNLHGSVVHAKNSLIDLLNQDGNFKYSINGVPSEPEGYVAYTPTGITKLVKRHNFSKHNFVKHSNG